MSSGRSLYQRRPERYGREKKNFQRLIEKLKRLASERGYSKKQIATQLGVSHTLFGIISPRQLRGCFGRWRSICAAMGIRPGTRKASTGPKSTMTNPIMLSGWAAAVQEIRYRDGNLGPNSPTTSKFFSTARLSRLVRIDDSSDNNYGGRSKKKDHL
jgi:hypothetical protein